MIFNDLRPVKFIYNSYPGPYKQNNAEGAAAAATVALARRKFLVIILRVYYRVDQSRAEVYVHFSLQCPFKLTMRNESYSLLLLYIQVCSCTEMYR